jgi:hypothetical protein
MEEVPMMVSDAGQVLTAILAWSVVLILLALLLLSVARRPSISRNDSIAVLFASLCIASAGAITAVLAMAPDGLLDVHVMRTALIVLRGVGTAVYLGVLLHQAEWPRSLTRGSRT